MILAFDFDPKSPPYANVVNDSLCKAIIGQVGGSLHGDYLFKGPFQRREVRVEDAQLSPQVVAGFPVLGLIPQPSVPKAIVLTNTPQLDRLVTSIVYYFFNVQWTKIAK